MKHSVKLAALALASLAALVSSAQAATPTFTTGDLVLSVFETDPTATGYGTVYEADLGPLSNFSASVSNLSLASNVNITDLTTLFGSSLSSASYLVAGTNSTSQLKVNGVKPANNSVLITDSTGTPPSADANYSQLSSSGSAASVGQFASSVAGGNGLSNGFSTEITETTPTNVSGSASFNFTPGDINPLVGFNSSASFFLLNNGNAASNASSFVHPNGTFDFVNGTTFTFNPATAPEPSTYALMGLGALVLVIAARRRMASNA